MLLAFCLREVLRLRPFSSPKLQGDPARLGADKMLYTPPNQALETPFRPKVIETGPSQRLDDVRNFAECVKHIKGAQLRDSGLLECAGKCMKAKECCVVMCIQSEAIWLTFQAGRAYEFQAFHPPNTSVSAIVPKSPLSSVSKPQTGRRLGFTGGQGRKDGGCK
jgi:hypothetical protein